MGRLLIVNADDFGRTAGINEGILRAHRHGLVSSATLMVNYPEARAAAQSLAENPDLGVGLHVALTGGFPLLSVEQVPSLVDDAGLLPRNPEAISGFDPVEVSAEVRAQLERFRELTGQMPTHLDSHHHSHRLPVVLDALLEVAVEHRLPVRNSGPAIEERVRSAGLATTEYFDEDFFDQGATVETLLRVLRDLPSGTTELMCHPARVDQELMQSSSYATPREAELAALTDREVLRALETSDIELVSFAELATA